MSESLKYLSFLENSLDLTSLVIWNQFLCGQDISFINLMHFYQEIGESHDTTPLADYIFLFDLVYCFILFLFSDFMSVYAQIRSNALVRSLQG